MFIRQSKMRARGAGTSVAYWLIPAEPMRRFLAGTIAELAAHFEAPLFEPHVTVYATRIGNDDPAEVLTRALSDCNSFRLSVRDIQGSDEFVRTLFLQFEPSPQLAKLSQTLQQASALHDEYQLNPHMSLIYKTMPQAMRMEVAASVSLPFTEVHFDSAKAISGPAQVGSRQDVEAWLVEAEQRLLP
jgi:2'-5' RNA ligase superfamily protein